MHFRPLKNKKAFTLFEVAIALGLAGMAALAVSAIMHAMFSSTQHSYQKSSVDETIRAVQTAIIDPIGCTANLKGMPGASSASLPNVSISGQMINGVFVPFNIPYAAGMRIGDNTTIASFTLNNIIAAVGAPSGYFTGQLVMTFNTNNINGNKDLGTIAPKIFPISYQVDSSGNISACAGDISYISNYCTIFAGIWNGTSCTQALATPTPPPGNCGPAPDNSACAGMPDGTDTGYYCCTNGTSNSCLSGGEGNSAQMKETQYTCQGGVPTKQTQFSCGSC